MKYKLTIYHRPQKYSNEEILFDIHKIAEANGGLLREAEYKQLGGKYSSDIISERFGGWKKALIAAGINPSPAHNKPTEEALLENIENIWLKLGRQPKQNELKPPLSKYSKKPYQSAFGSWIKAIEKFVEVANAEPAQEELNVSTENTKREIGNDKKAVETKPKASPTQEEGIKHKTKRDINWRMRWQVLDRDNFRCVSCGLSPAIAPGTILHVDHIKPWSKGGETVLENLQTLCATCNLGKSNIE